MNFPNELTYAKTHEWLKKDGDLVEIGLTDFAQDQLGDIVFVNLPEVGDVVSMANLSLTWNRSKRFLIFTALSPAW